MIVESLLSRYKILIGKWSSDPRSETDQHIKQTVSTQMFP